MALEARAIIPATDEGQPTLEQEWRAHASLSRLKALHNEAAETATLANLLGRSIPVASALIAGGFAAALFANAANAQAIAWGALLVLASAALALSWKTLIQQAFVRGTLRKFAHHLDAIMLYAGFAWGAGAYLVLPADAGLLGYAAFGAGMPALVAFLLHARKPALLFVGPVAFLAGLAPLIRPASSDFWASIAVLGGCALVAMAIEITHEMRVIQAKSREIDLLPA